MKARMETRYNAQVEKSVEKRKPVSLYFRFSPGGYLIDIIIKDIYKYEKRVKRRDFQAPSGGGFVVWMESYEHGDASLYSFLIFLNGINPLKANSLYFRLRFSPGAVAAPQNRIEPHPFKVQAEIPAPTRRGPRPNRSNLKGGIDDDIDGAPAPCSRSDTCRRHADAAGDPRP